MPIVAPGISYTYAFKIYLYKFAIYTFDIFDELLTLLFTSLGHTTSNSGAERKCLESDDWSDEEIIRRYEVSRNVHRYNRSTVRKICNDTVVKLTSDLPDDPEVAHINLVHANTSILTPAIRRTFRYKDDHWIVMEYIEGQQVDHCWNWISYWTRLRITFTLRRYIKQLRRIQSEHSKVPGPVASTPQLCRGLIFGAHDSGPFKTPKLLSRWLRHMHNVDRHYKVGEKVPIPFDESKPLVFTHHDIRGKNVLLGRDGRIWLIDWGLSGFYPEWFEYVAMSNGYYNDRAPQSWYHLMPFIADPYMLLADYIGNTGVYIIPPDMGPIEDSE